jgi:two-component system, chemotaxis family, chemotaxis protein CheY
MRALIVDDSRTSRMRLRKMLEEESIACEEVVSAEEGMKRLRSGEEFDLMLVDWNMPGMSGPEMIEQVRQQGMAELKILMVTSEVETECVARALEAGANEFLMKPFDVEAFKEKLTRMGLEPVAR